MTFRRTLAQKSLTWSHTHIPCCGYIICCFVWDQICVISVTLERVYVSTPVIRHIMKQSCNWRYSYASSIECWIWATVFWKETSSIWRTKLLKSNEFRHVDYGLTLIFQIEKCWTCRSWMSEFSECQNAVISSTFGKKNVIQMQACSIAVILHLCTLLIIQVFVVVQITGIHAVGFCALGGLKVLGIPIFSNMTQFGDPWKFALDIHIWFLCRFLRLCSSGDPMSSCPLDLRFLDWLPATYYYKKNTAIMSSRCVITDIANMMQSGENTGVSFFNAGGMTPPRQHHPLHLSIQQWMPPCWGVS